MGLLIFHASLIFRPYIPFLFSFHSVHGYICNVFSDITFHCCVFCIANFVSLFCQFFMWFWGFPLDIWRVCLLCHILFLRYKCLVLIVEIQFSGMMFADQVFLCILWQLLLLFIICEYDDKVVCKCYTWNLSMMYSCCPSCIGIQMSLVPDIFPFP